MKATRADLTGPLQRRDLIAVLTYVNRSARSQRCVDGSSAIRKPISTGLPRLPGCNEGSLARSVLKGLPQLSGGPLLLYRALWTALAIGAISASILVLNSGGGGCPEHRNSRRKERRSCFAPLRSCFCRRGRDPVAALLALAFLTWAITSSFDFATTAMLPRLLDRFRFLLFALALLLFPDGRWKPGWTRTVAILSIGVFSLGVGEASGFVPTRLFLPLAIPCVLAGIASLVIGFADRRITHSSSTQVGRFGIGGGRRADPLRPRRLCDVDHCAGVHATALGGDVPNRNYHPRARVPRLHVAFPAV